MITTQEIRWFYPGELPPSIQSWFQHNCLINPLQFPQIREDVYLYSPNCEYLGIKIREERLEVKWRQAQLGIFRFSNYTEGKVEKWTKWLCYPPDGENFYVKNITNEPTWINVRKIRYSQDYQIVSDVAPQPVIGKQDIDNGCSVEITNLQIREQLWWSLALEAFGEVDCLMLNLQKTASHIFQNYQGLELLADHSYPYPAWLDKNHLAG